MAGLEIIFPVSTVFNLQSADKTMADINSAFSKAAQSFKLDPGALRGGQNLVDTMLGGKENFTKMIDAAATGVGKLSTTFANVRDKAGNVFQIQTGQVTELSGVLGGAQTITKNFAKEQESLNARLKSGELVLESYSSQVATMAANERFEGESLKAVEKELERYSGAADRMDSKLKNMRGSQVKNAQAAIANLRNEINTFQALSSKTQATKADLDRLEQAFKDVGVAMESTKAGANVFQNFGTRIANAVQQTIAYSLSLGMVYKAQQFVSDSVKYAIELNKEMTNIQVLQAEGAQTPEEINALADSFNKLGQEMGASTIEIAKGSVEWLRQGRTVAETQELMRSSLMLSKLGAMDAADATNYLTSITNAFKISTEEAVTVVDKLIAVDNISATSAGELATAMRYTSESAALAGVSMEQLVSYIATVSTVTRQNAEMIGQAFKTMFARMTLIQGGGLDETGMSISKVEKALKAVNIEIKNSDGTWKNMGNVMEEVAAKWNTLSIREQTELATSIAGVRQKEAFLVLMTNMDKALTYQASEVDANGLAMERYGIYLDSVEAKQGQLTAAIQELQGTIVSGGLVKAFYDIAIGIVKTITNAKSLIPILITILGILIAIKQTQIASALTKAFDMILNNAGSVLAFLKNLKLNIELVGVAFSEVKAGTMTMSAALGTIPALFNPVTLAILGVTAAVAAGIAIWQKHKKAVEDGKQAIQDYINALGELPTKRSQAKETIEAINEIISAAGGTAAPTNELLSLFEQLQAILPNLDWHYLDGRPYLTADQMAVLNLNEELQKTILLTQEQRNNIQTALRSESGEFDILAYEAGNYSTQVQSLSDILAAFKDQKFTGPQGFGEWWADYQSKLEDLPEGAVDALRIIGVTMTDPSFWSETGEGVGKNFEDLIQRSLDDATSNLHIKEDRMKNMADDWKQWISAALSSTDDEMQAWVSYMDSQFGNNQYWQYMKGEVESDKNLAILEGNKRKWLEYVSMPHGRGGGGTREPEVTEADITAANNAYDQQITLINQVASALQAVIDADTTTLEGKEAINKAMLDFRNAVAGLGPEYAGLADEVLSYYDAEKDAWDTTGLEAWLRTSITGSDLFADKLALIAKAFHEQAPLVAKFADDSIGSIQRVEAETVTLYDMTGKSIQMSAERGAKAADWLAQSVWGMVENADKGIRLVADDGSVVTAYSVSDVQAMITAGIISVENFSEQALKILAENASASADIVNQALANISKGLPAPPPLALPSGGGGGGTEKDPRIKALEDKIEKEQDAIDLLKDQIELYNRQKEAIDRLIDDENWKKELLDRQIEIYQRQIDKLDRQVELYNRQKEAIDRIIDGYEKQKDAIDKLIDQQEELKKPLEDQKKDLDARLKAFKEYIDLQKESLERLKDETDYLDELKKKTGDVAKIQAELALASLDTSEAGQKRRLELEEQLANKQEDLTQFTEDRKYDLQIRALDDTLKAFEDGIDKQKALLDDQLAKIQEIIDGYNTQKDAIDALIEPLQAEKDAIDALILPLEDQKTALEDMIYPLEQQKQAIDDVIRGYEDQKRAIDDLIEPIQDQIQLMEDRIKLWEREKEAIQELIDAMGGSGGGGGGGGGGQWSLASAVQAVIGYFNLLGQEAGFTEDAISRMIENNLVKFGTWEAAINATIAQMLRLKQESDNARRAAEEAIRIGGISVSAGAGGPVNTTPAVGNGGNGPENPNEQGGHPYGNQHQGGLVEEHHEGEFAGNLNTNEVFSKLLKGEYVATEAQMREFFRSTLPSMAKEIGNMYQEEEKKRASEKTKKLDIIPIKIFNPSTRPSPEIIKPIGYGREDYNKYGDMNFEMNITVEGTLDKTVLPELKKSVIKEINKSLEKRGIKRTANNFAI